MNDAWCVLAGGVCGFAVSAAATPVVRALSLRIGFVDRPGAHKQHGRITPLGGGVAITLGIVLPIAAAVAAALLAGADMLPAWAAVHAEGVQSRLTSCVVLLAGAVALHIMGLVDDRRVLGAWPKFIIQIAVSLLVVIGAQIRIYLFVPNDVIGYGLAALWVVVITNAFNFLDNMDGLSAGIAAICAAVCAGAGWLSGQVFVPAVAATVCGAAAGFWLYNTHPAKVFMGDAGSLVLGYMVAVVAIMTTYYVESSPMAARTAVLAPLVVLAVPLYDFVSVMLIRIRRGANVMVGDRNHFSHRLVQRGMTVPGAVGTIHLATACTAVGALFLVRVGGFLAIWVFVQTACILALIWLLERSGHGRQNG